MTGQHLRPSGRLPAAEKRPLHPCESRSGSMGPTKRPRKGNEYTGMVPSVVRKPQKK